MANWDITTANNYLTFDTTYCNYQHSLTIDSNHYITVFQSYYYQEFSAQTFTVNTSTWAVTTANSVLDIHTNTSTARNDLCWLDSNHCVVIYQEYDYVHSQVLTVNTSTYAVTTTGAYQALLGTYSGNALVNYISDGVVSWIFKYGTQLYAVGLHYDGSYAYDDNGGLLDIYPSATIYEPRTRPPKIDDNHLLLFYRVSDGDGNAQVLEVNTSTYVVSTSNSALTFTTDIGVSGSAIQIDSNYYINSWAEDDSFNGGNIQVQAFNVNTSTYAVTTAGSALEVTTTEDSGIIEAIAIDSSHFILYWEKDENPTFNMYAQVFSVNTSTWAITTASSPLLCTIDSGVSQNASVVEIEDGHYFTVIRGDDAGCAQVFEVEIPEVGGTGNSERNIYLKGLTTSDSERVVYIQGKLTADSERSIYLDADVDDIFSYENASDLESDDATLSNTFVEQDYTDVESDNDIYVCAEGTSAYCKFLFQKYNDGESQSPVSITWKGKSTEAPSSSTVYLQIYNREDTAWENLDSDDSTAENTEFTLSGSQSTDLSDYFDENYVVAFRIYQEVT